MTPLVIDPNALIPTIRAQSSPVFHRLIPMLQHSPIPNVESLGEAALAADESDWLAKMKSAVRDLPSLAQRLQLSSDWVARECDDQTSFPVFVPEPYLSRIELGRPDDPLLRQVLPLTAEADSARGFTTDPVEDLDHSSDSGVIRKYHGRALLIAAGACAIHCRYCFRRHFPYSQAPSSGAQWQPALDRLGKDETLTELILSGGDPLTLRDAVLAELIQRAEATLPRVSSLRIHTRLPVVIPTRVTRGLLEMLRESRFRVVVVLHANHSREIDGNVEQACRALRDAGCLLLNQAVLLAGVNDRVEILADLSETLLRLNVVPYYLNQLDRVQGAAHFEVPVRKGLEIVAAMQAQLPGYAVPRYVQDVPGSPSKQNVQ